DYISTFGSSRAEALAMTKELIEVFIQASEDIGQPLPLANRAVPDFARFATERLTVEVGAR
ncbi:MAG: hypothetical protein NTZ05_06590, partial [Chloroflexi bacterium]|nr:hypothetical protein [Chloroflexota bacterium]